MISFFKNRSPGRKDREGLLRVLIYKNTGGGKKDFFWGKEDEQKKREFQTSAANINQGIPGKIFWEIKKKFANQEGGADANRRQLSDNSRAKGLWAWKIHRCTIN